MLQSQHKRVTLYLPHTVISACASGSMSAVCARATRTSASRPAAEAAKSPPPGPERQTETDRHRRRWAISIARLARRLDRASALTPPPAARIQSAKFALLLPVLLADKMGSTCPWESANGAGRPPLEAGALPPPFAATTGQSSARGAYSSLARDGQLEAYWWGPSGRISESCHTLDGVVVIVLVIVVVAVHWPLTVSNRKRTTESECSMTTVASGGDPSR